MKEQLCYVSHDIVKELSAGKYSNRAIRASMKDAIGGKLRKNFVLPNFQTVLKGFVKPDDEPLNNDEQVRYMTHKFLLLSSFFSGILLRVYLNSVGSY